MRQTATSKLLNIRPQDYLLCAGILVASVYWLISPTEAGGKAPSSALLRHGGAALAELPLDRPAVRTFNLEAGRITVEVVPGKGIHILDTNCPAKTCLHHGWISRTGETIACLPNKLLVEVEGEDSGYDAVIH